jgi:LemA protein
MAGFFNKAEGSVLTDKQRLQRTEAILGQLYREDVNPKFQIPAMKGVRMLATISLLSITLFTGTLFYKFNDFILLREDTHAKMGNLESALQRRENLFSNMINLTLNHASLEHNIFAYAAKSRTEIAKQQGFTDDAQKELLARAETMAGKAGIGLPDNWQEGLKSLMGGGVAEGSGASLGRLLAVVEQYPNIQSSKTYQHMMTSLVNMEDLIATRRIEYNDSLRMYNTSISKFPWKLLAHWTDFKRQAYFTTANPGKTAPLITNQKYEILMPFEEMDK